MAPEDIAEQLVTQWQKEGRMPQMSWDFRGFAAAAARMGAAVEREATLNKVLAGLRSEDDSTQLRAIIASVEALRSNGQS